MLAHLVPQSVIVQLQSSCPFCDVAMPSFWLSFSQSCALDWSQFYMFLSCWFSYLSYIVLYCRIAHFIRKCHRFNILKPSFVWWFILWSSGSVPSDNECSVRQMIHPTYRADLKFIRFLCPTQQLEGRPHRNKLLFLVPYCANFGSELENRTRQACLC